jgi:hypothetical protein
MLDRPAHRVGPSPWPDTKEEKPDRGGWAGPHQASTMIGSKL